MREITGKELERALLKTQGRTWDGVPLPKLTVADLKQDLLIGLCAIMMVISVVLYIIKNTRTLRGETA